MFEAEIEAIEAMPRELAVITGLRKLAPRPESIPTQWNVKVVESIDTGAAFRPDWRMQDPAKDPKEPYGSESSGTGNDHGWSNCTMVSAALVYAYHVKDKSGPQGGDMRHHQDDMSGGTDLYDAKTAWDRYGNQTLTIKTGAGWGAVKTAHNEGRAILIQGEGNVPGAETFDGSHACAIGIETNSEGDWLWGDPLATGWQWVPPSKIESWAKALHSSIMFAVSKVVASEPTPPPTPPAEPDPPKPPVFYPAKPAPDYEVAAYSQDILRDMHYWIGHPSGTPPFPVGDALEAIMHPNESWDEGRWNQTTWYLDPDSGRWGQATWAGVADVQGGTWA